MKPKLYHEQNAIGLQPTGSISNTKRIGCVNMWTGMTIVRDRKKMVGMGPARRLMEQLNPTKLFSEVKEDGAIVTIWFEMIPWTNKTLLRHEPQTSG